MENPFKYLDSAALSDVGKRRKNNEDSLIMLPEHGVFCVADGMGGAKGGEIASKATCEMLQTVYSESPDAPFAVTVAAGTCLAARALNRASQWIKNHAEEHGLTGCGSTAVLLLFDRVTPTRAAVLHAGDSRAYRLRKGKLQQLSTDHSVAAAAGVADEKDLPAMFRGVITRAVGLESTVKLEETLVDVQPDDLFFLCSDGLSKMVSDKQMQKLLQRHSKENVSELAKHLIDQALHAGGEDNVSVVLVRVATVLPEAPTMQVSPETLALEASVAAEVAGLSSITTIDNEAPTRETGETMDTAGDLSHEERVKADSNSDITPPTPISAPGVTPESSPQVLSKKQEYAPWRLLLLLGLVLLLVGAGVGVLLLMPGLWGGK